MIVLSSAALIVAAYAFASVYLRKAKQYLDDSEVVWDRLYEAARETIADSEMPRFAVGFAAGAVLCAGCGCLTRGILLDALSGRLRRALTAPPSDAERAMTLEQRKLFSRVVVNAVLYDALSAPLAGFILRRFVAPWLRAASEGAVPAKKREVAEMARASTKVINHREEGRKLLAMA